VYCFSTAAEPSPCATTAGGTIQGFKDRKANPPPEWPSDLPKPKGQTVASFRRGLATFPRGLAARLGERVKVSWTLTGVERAADGTYQLSYDTPEGGRTVASRAVIFTLPSHAFAPLLRLPAPPVADALASMYYPPLSAVTVAYPESAIREDRLAVGGGKLVGFGQLHPRSQGIVTLGTIYSSVLFPERCPPGEVLLLNYIGGAKNTGIATQSQADIVAQVDKDLRIMLLRPDAPPPKVLGVRVWQQAIPQFNIGHLDVMCASLALASQPRTRADALSVHACLQRKGARGAGGARLGGRLPGRQLRGGRGARSLRGGRLRVRRRGGGLARGGARHAAIGHARVRRV
jgi:oxygen-dependent protoporphyrinogen oxidase